MLPGRSSIKLRLKFWAVMFASHGLVALAPDLKSHGVAAQDGRKFLQATEEYPVDPTNIHLMGYSAGAHTVLTNALGKGTDRFKSFIVVAGIKPEQLLDHSSNPNPILIIQ